MQFGRSSNHRPFTLGRKPIDREPSLLEVLYPPKQAGTRPYVPAYAPGESEQEKYYRNANQFFGLVRGVCALLAIVLLTPVVLILLVMVMAGL